MKIPIDHPTMAEKYVATVQATNIEGRIAKVNRQTVIVPPESQTVPAEPNTTNTTTARRAETMYVATAPSGLPPFN